MRPVVKILNSGGADVAAQFQHRIVSVAISDAEEHSSATFEIEFDDRDEGLALPRIGDKVRVALGYVGRFMATVGDFVIDEVRLAGPPLQVAIRGKGAPMSRSALIAPATREYDTRTLADLAQQIANHNGMQAVVHDDAHAVEITHVVQHAESDLSLLTRVARARGFVVRLDATRMIVRPHAASLSADDKPPAVKLRQQDITSYEYERNARSEVGTVRASYYDADRAQRVPVVVSAEHADEQRVFDLRHDAQSAQDAERQARARLAQLARASETLRITMPGEPRILAGHHVLLTGLAPPVGGHWVVDKCTHRLDAKGMQSELACVMPTSRVRTSAQPQGMSVEEFLRLGD